GIRDRNVTGVQTCALPISSSDLENLLWHGQRSTNAKRIIAIHGSTTKVTRSSGSATNTPPSSSACMVMIFSLMIQQQDKLNVMHATCLNTTGHQWANELSH